MKINTDSVFEGDYDILCISDYTFNKTVEFKKDKKYRVDTSSVTFGLVSVIDQDIPVRVGMNFEMFNEHFMIISNIL